jgi:hypothetical protein
VVDAWVATLQDFADFCYKEKEQQHQWEAMYLKIESWSTNISKLKSSIQKRGSSMLHADCHRLQQKVRNKLKLRWLEKLSNNDSVLPGSPGYKQVEFEHPFLLQTSMRHSWKVKAAQNMVRYKSLIFGNYG